MTTDLTPLSPGHVSILYIVSGLSTLINSLVSTQTHHERHNHIKLPRTKV